uniref:Uncharacterized protein n=1 Tax=Arundo donax TaxID=35708 RepID=A0A0A9CBE5_ARUDO
MPLLQPGLHWVLLQLANLPHQLQLVVAHSQSCSKQKLVCRNCHQKHCSTHLAHPQLGDSIRQKRHNLVESLNSGKD